MSSATPGPADDRRFRLPPKVLRGVHNAMERVANLSTISALADCRFPLPVTPVRLPPMPELDAAITQLRNSIVHQLDFEPLLEPLRQLSASIARYYPANWVEFDVDPDAALRVAQDEGLPLVWVPRGELVTALLDGPDAASRRGLLAANVNDIVADCAAVAAAVTHQSLREHRDRLLDATHAHQLGLHAPAQAMTTVVLTALLQWVYAHKELRKVKVSDFRMPEDAEEVAFRLFKVAVLIEAAVPAVQGGRDKLPDEALDRFNRHDTLHRVADEAYTPPNAMTALLLATGLLAEADRMLEDGTLAS
jgi:hypothetical protein